MFPSLIEGFELNEFAIEDERWPGTQGKIKGRIYFIKMRAFEFSNPILAAPDENSLLGLKITPGRKGSIGNEILRRFRVIFDYADERLYLEKNKNFKQSFLVNKSGLQIRCGEWSGKSRKSVCL